MEYKTLGIWGQQRGARGIGGAVRYLVLLVFQNEAPTACSNCAGCTLGSLQAGDFLSPWEIVWEEKGGSMWKQP